MARETWALVLLLALAIISCWNIHTVNKLCDKIDAQLQTSETAAQSENWEDARQAMEKAVDTWLNAEKYTHVFIRHPEIDSCTDVLYEALSAVLEQDLTGLDATLQKLRYHIRSIAGMEQIRFGNIF